MNFSIQNLVLGIVNQCGGAPNLNEINNFINNKGYRFSSAVEVRLNGFSFYSYPTAIEYSCHMPVLVDGSYSPKQYLKILFNF